MWFKRDRKKQAPVVPIEGHGDALVAIAEEDRGALKIVGDIMERNTAENLRALQVALEREESAHSKTLGELREMRKELTTIWGRIDWLLGGDMPYEMRVEFEEIVEETLERERTREAS